MARKSGKIIAVISSVTTLLEHEGMSFDNQKVE
jgi:hypothetical protein